jgi:hypothetical protein
MPLSFSVFFGPTIFDPWTTELVDSINGQNRFLSDQIAIDLCGFGVDIITRLMKIGRVRDDSNAIADRKFATDFGHKKSPSFEA